MIDIGKLGYYWLDSWVLANVIQLSTQDFCLRYLNHKNDPCGRQFDQMTQAARSVTANIAEGSSRRSTSKETEMKLTDVARASLAELSNDYQNWLLLRGAVPWSVHSAEHQAVKAVQLDHATYKDDVLHESSIHILAQKRKFSHWIDGDDPLAAANCLLILCDRLILMLGKQIARQLNSFREEGGFTEGLTAERLAYRTQQHEDAGAPVCPKCGKGMIKRVAKKGINSGREFWSCSGYPECNGTRSI